MPVGSTDDLSCHKPYPLTSIREGWAHHDQKSNRGSPCQKGGQRTQVVKWKLTFVEPTGLACCLLRGLSPRSKKRPRLTVHDVSWGWPRARPARSLCKEWLHLPRRTGTGTGVAGSNAARGAAPCARHERLQACSACSISLHWQQRKACPRPVQPPWGVVVCTPPEREARGHKARPKLGRDPRALQRRHMRSPQLGCSVFGLLRACQFSSAAASVQQVCHRAMRMPHTNLAALFFLRTSTHTPQSCTIRAQVMMQGTGDDAGHR